MAQKTSQAYIGASWVALGAGMLGYLIGLWRAEMQLNEKYRLIQSINDQLDRKITNLNRCMDRADALLVRHCPEADSIKNRGVAHCQQKEISALYEKGHDIAKIATALSIPKEEVRLVLGIRKRCDAGVKRVSVV